jgi:hypothetical protein
LSLGHTAPPGEQPPGRIDESLGEISLLHEQHRAFDFAGRIRFELLGFLRTLLLGQPGTRASVLSSGDPRARDEERGKEENW